MLTLPLKEDAIKRETSFIKEIAQINGYDEHIIDALINKKRKKLWRKSMTTLKPSEEKTPLRVPITFEKSTAYRLRKALKKCNLDIIFTSRSNQLSSLLGSTKDPREQLEKCGVYKITCPECDVIYIGQTKRSLKTRCEEHTKEAEKLAKETEEKRKLHHFKSKVAEHIINKEHEITCLNIELLHNITKSNKLDAAESLEIFKHSRNNLLNRDTGNCYSELFQLVNL